MRPFGEGDTHSTFRAHVDKVLGQISALDNEYVLKSSVTELEQHFVDELTIWPLVLHPENKYILAQTGVKIDVSHDLMRAVFPGERAEVQGTQVDLAIPYEGDQVLWRLSPSTFTLSGYPEIDVRKDIIVIGFRFPDDAANQDKLSNDIESVMRSLEDAIANLRQDVAGHNANALARVKAAIQTKRTMAQSVVGAVSSLGIPYKRTDEPPKFMIPTTRRPSPARLPAVQTGKYEAEPALDDREYEFILKVLYSMATVIERSPSSFKQIEEEAIRDHFLIQLNGHYEGGATGETFNAAGKTDILIRVGNKNVFVAECKFWHGPKSLSDAVDQLLSYLTWRDSKCALLIFNRNKDSASVREKMHAAILARPEHRKTFGHSPDGDSRYVLVKQSDPGREIVLATQLYDLPL